MISDRRTRQGRFAPGYSGNGRGRPKKPRQASPFEILLDKRMIVTQGGQEREMSVDEALLWKTFQEALAGNTMARRVVLKKIEKRDKAILAKQPQPGTDVEVLEESPCQEFDYEVLEILGIARRDALDHWQLEGWAAELGAKRLGKDDSFARG